MKPILRSCLFATLVMLALSPSSSAAQPKPPVPIIFDTDMDSDCDDAAALALLHALADMGEALILATMVSSKYEWAAPCVDAINTYFKRPDLPIGVPKSPGPVWKSSLYARQVAQEFPHDKKPFAEAPDATPIYRKILAAQPDGSVVIVTVGDLTNIRYLLESQPDTLSPLDGTELARRKVRQWVCMGTRYPADLDPNKWGNFKIDPDSTVKAIAGWPGLITFTGGQEFAQSLATGKSLADVPKSSPVRRAYELYFGGTVKSRHSADLIAVYVAVRGTGAPWKLVREGFNFIFPDGRHEWRTAPDNPNQEYISALADGVKAQDVIALMDELIVWQPGGR